MVTTLERIEDAESGIRQRSRYVGLAAFYRNRIFITERTRGDAPTFGQTVLMPFEVHQRLFLRGSLWVCPGARIINPTPLE